MAIEGEARRQHITTFLAASSPTAPPPFQGPGRFLPGNGTPSPALQYPPPGVPPSRRLSAFRACQIVPPQRSCRMRRNGRMKHAPVGFPLCRTVTTVAKQRCRDAASAQNFTAGQVRQVNHACRGIRPKTLRPIVCRVPAFRRLIPRARLA